MQEGGSNAQDGVAENAPDATRPPAVSKAAQAPLHGKGRADSAHMVGELFREWCGCVPRQS